MAIAREQLENQEIVNDVETGLVAIYGVSEFDRLSTLPGVSEEVTNVADTIPGEETVLENEEVTLEAIQGLANGRYEIIHFSSHGDTDTLILSDGQQDVRVTTDQIATLNIATKLLVLAL